MSPGWEQVVVVFNEVHVPVDLGHPMAQVTRRFNGVRGRLQVNWDSQGQRFSIHTLWGSRSVQREYVRQHARSGAPNVCTRMETTWAGPRKGVWLTGPCECEESCDPCREITSLLEEIHNLLPGRSRLDSVEFDISGSTAVVTHFEQGPLPQTDKPMFIRPLKEPPFHGGEGDTEIDPVEARTIREAVRLGYYDRPRRITMEELAQVLGVTKSAVCRRLNKMETTAVLRLLDKVICRSQETPSELTKSEGMRKWSSRQGKKIAQLAH